MAPLNLEKHTDNDFSISIISRMPINVDRVSNSVTLRINVFPQ